MAFHIRNSETDALARRLARVKGTGVTEAVHIALRHELEREGAEPSLVEAGLAFIRDVRGRTHPAGGKPADKAFATVFTRTTRCSSTLPP